MTEWTPDLIVNHDLLDRQHAEIFRRIDDVALALELSEDAVEIAVAALADILVTHLAAEEGIMIDALYPERVRHKSAHELFMADFMRLREELRTEGATSTVADWLTRRVPEWLRFHITVNDIPLGMYLARRREQQEQQQQGAPPRPAKDSGGRPS